MKSFRQNSGMTLIELLVVLAIVGIVSAAFVAPRLTVLPSSQLFSSGHQLERELSNLRERAMQTNLVQKMVFHPGSADYDVFSKHSTQNIWVVARPIQAIHSAVTIGNTSLADNQIIFGTDGVPYEDNQVDLPDSSTDLALTVVREIILQGSGGLQRLVRITPDTGYIFLEVAP